MTLRIVTVLFCLAVLLSLTACQPGSSKDNVFLVVEFDPQVPLKYKLISERDSSVTFDAKSAKMKPVKIYEKLEMVISYQPVGKPDVYGLTTIKATCHSAKVTRKAKRRSPGKDSAEGLTGRSYTFKISPTGKIVDYSNLSKLAVEIGSKSISGSGSHGNFKSPDMTTDFVCLQWYLWDSLAKSGQTTSGLKPGASWTTNQIIPLPLPSGTVRETTYTLGDVEEGVEDSNKVIIDSTYAIGKREGLKNWPRIYPGRFQIKGMFGFLRGFTITSIAGTGRQIFDAEKGILEKDVQQYKAKFSANLLFSLPGAGVSPEMIVDQKMSVELLDN
jgi:hypothetical protein